MDIHALNKNSTSQVDKIKADELYRFTKMVSQEVSVLVQNDEYKELVSFLKSLNKDDLRFKQIRLCLDDSDANESTYSVFIQNYKIGVIVLVDNRNSCIPLPVELAESSSIDFISILNEVRGKELGKLLYEKIYTILNASKERFISSPVRLSDSAFKLWSKLERERSAKDTGFTNLNNQPIFEYIHKN